MSRALIPIRIWPIRELLWVWKASPHAPVPMLECDPIIESFRRGIPLSKRLIQVVLVREVGWWLYCAQMRVRIESKMWYLIINISFK